MGKRGPSLDQERMQCVLTMRQEGQTYRVIGRAFGVTPQCIEQLIHRERLLATQRRYKLRRSGEPA